MSFWMSSVRQVGFLAWTYVLGSIKFLCTLVIVERQYFRHMLATTSLGSCHSVLQGHHTLQKAMNHTLAPLLRRSVLVFFNDILIYSKTYDDHIQHIQHVFQLLQKEQWIIKRSKCSFAKREIAYLGYMISVA
jgi:hypothetical protein